MIIWELNSDTTAFIVTDKCRSSGMSRDRDENICNLINLLKVIFIKTFYFTNLTDNFSILKLIIKQNSNNALYIVTKFTKGK